MGWWWMLCCRLWLADLFFCYSSIWQPVMEGFSLLPSLSLSNKSDSIGHNWLLFEDRYWSPRQTLHSTHPPPPFSLSLILLTSLFLLPPPYFFQAVSPSHLAAATLISMLDGVPSSVQTNSWINRRVQTLSSLFPAQMVENSNATRWKPRGGEAETERERWQGWSGWRTSEMILLTFFFLLLCYSMISGKIMKDELHTASHNTSEKEGKVNGI